MNIAVIFAGGIGSRMKTKGIPKQFLKINSIPVIVHTLFNFQFNKDIDQIVVVMLEEYIPYMNELKEQFHLDKISSIVKGGSTGQESIYNGLVAARNISNNSNPIVLIHDGVRPIIEPDLINKNIESVRTYGTAISSVPSKETIVNIDNDRTITNITDRTKAWIARAPQSFYLNDILQVHEQALKDGYTNCIDSCTMMNMYGKKLHVVETCMENIKITTPEDYFVVQGILNAQTSEDMYGARNE